jgi:hypothetical protein
MTQAGVVTLPETQKRSLMTYEGTLMLNDYGNLHWQDIKYKGYLHVKGFLSGSEIQMLCDDWAKRSAAVKGSANGNYPLVDISQIIVWRLQRKINSVADAVYAATGINADANAGGDSYFATSKGVNFSWHQDHESYFIYQQHLEYLNFYIPVVKPDIKRTNLCLVPLDQLQSRIPEQFGDLVGAGARRYYPEGSVTRVCDDDDGAEFTLPVNFEELKVTPELEPGDLLLLRGDVIHRTQDTETQRVAVSFRRTSSTAVISRAKFETGCARKHEMMRANWGLYETMFGCLDELKLDEVTAGQFHSYVLKKAAT